jgi:hypothetical protein
MPKCCIVCKVEASPDILIQYCDQCQSAMYCSKACQRKDWKPRHKKLCKLLNVGHGGMQLRTETHTRLSTIWKEQFEEGERRLTEDMKRFFKLFQESTLEGSQAAALKMKKIAKRQNKRNQKYLLFYSLKALVRFSNSEMLSWPNSPLLVLLQFLDPSMLLGDEDTPLHCLALLADSFDYSTHVNQLILTRQLIEHGANVNALSSPDGKAPLHDACRSFNVTNLDFVELLLEKGADPNAQNFLGETPLFYTTMHAPGAAKLLLNWPTTDITIISRSGDSFPVRVRRTIKDLTDKIAVPDNPEMVQDQLLLQQWREIEDMVVERGA